jgi:hypothetical protein
MKIIIMLNDTTLGYSSSSPDALELVINHDLNKLSTWSGQWLMSFNPDKTEIMVCSNMEIPKASGLELEYPKVVSSANNLVKERSCSPISFI